jgi:hypothetical protein
MGHRRPVVEVAGWSRCPTMRPVGEAVVDVLRRRLTIAGGATEVGGTVGFSDLERHQQCAGLFHRALVEPLRGQEPDDLVMSERVAPGGVTRPPVPNR